MSPKNQVHPLSYVCVKLVSTQLIHALSDDEGRNDVPVRRYLLDATYEVVEELLRHILASVNLDAATRFSCLRVLLRPDVRKLDTGIFPHSYYEDILRVIADRGTGLRQLNLKGVWVREHPLLLSRLIGALKRLRVLIIPHMADDRVLEAAAQCPSLAVLDVSGECAFTVLGLRRLRAASITLLDIGSFGKSDLCPPEESGSDVVAELIENLPNLTVLRTYSFTGSALLLLHRKNSRYKTRLKHLRDTRTSLEAADAIASTCEGLESVHLDSPAPGALGRLAALRRLACVKLVRHDGRDLLAFLRPGLRTLRLNHDKEAALDLGEVCLRAPGLETLECFQLRLSFGPDAVFVHLENVEILYCEMSDAALRCVLTNCPSLKRIVVGCVVRMTDGDVFRLCAECEFLRLEELWFSCARGLTVVSVELLMGHCPKLKVIGQLNGWDVHQEEVDYLRSVILYTNTDLTLLPLGTFA